MALRASRTLLTQIQLTNHQNNQVPFYSATFQHLIPQSVYISKIAPVLSQNMSLVFLKLHVVGLDLSAEPLCLPGSEQILQFRVINKLNKYPFKSRVQIINEDVEEHWEGNKGRTREAIFTYVHPPTRRVTF